MPRETTETREPTETRMTTETRGVTIFVMNEETHRALQRPSTQVVGYLYPFMVSCHSWYPESHKVMQPFNSCVEPVELVTHVDHLQSLKSAS